MVFDLIRNEAIHLVAAIALVLLLHKYYGWRYAILSMVGSLFLDVDHSFDYAICLATVCPGFSLDHVLSGHYFAATGKIYVLLHSWELAVALAFFKDRHGAFVPLSSGLAVHLLVDTLTNHVKWLAYSLLFRLYHNFSILEIGTA